MPSDADLTQLLRGLELQLLSDKVRHSRTSLDALLDDDFMEIGASGRTYNKRSVMEALLAEPTVERVIADFSVRRLAPGIALATYVVFRPEAGTRTARASIWRETSGRWRVVFHQGTPLSS